MDSKCLAEKLEENEQESNSLKQKIYHLENVLEALKGIVSAQKKDDNLTRRQWVEHQVSSDQGEGEKSLTIPISNLEKEKYPDGKKQLVPVVEEKCVLQDDKFKETGSKGNDKGTAFQPFVLNKKYQKTECISYHSDSNPSNICNSKKLMRSTKSISLKRKGEFSLSKKAKLKKLYNIDEVKESSVSPESTFREDSVFSDRTEKRCKLLKNIINDTNQHISNNTKKDEPPMESSANTFYKPPGENVYEKKRLGLKSSRYNVNRNDCFYLKNITKKNFKLPRNCESNCSSMKTSSTNFSELVEKMKKEYKTSFCSSGKAFLPKELLTSEEVSELPSFSMKESNDCSYNLHENGLSFERRPQVNKKINHKCFFTKNPASSQSSDLKNNNRLCLLSDDSNDKNIFSNAEKLIENNGNLSNVKKTITHKDNSSTEEKLVLCDNSSLNAKELITGKDNSSNTTKSITHECSQDMKESISEAHFSEDIVEGSALLEKLLEPEQKDLHALSQKNNNLRISSKYKLTTNIDKTEKSRVNMIKPIQLKTPHFAKPAKDSNSLHKSDSLNHQNISEILSKPVAPVRRSNRSIPKPLKAKSEVKNLLSYKTFGYDFNRFKTDSSPCSAELIKKMNQYQASVRTSAEVQKNESAISQMNVHSAASNTPLKKSDILEKFQSPLQKSKLVDTGSSFKTNAPINCEVQPELLKQNTKNLACGVVSHDVEKKNDPVASGESCCLLMKCKPLKIVIEDYIKQVRPDIDISHCENKTVKMIPTSTNIFETKTTEAVKLSKDSALTKTLSKDPTLGNLSVKTNTNKSMAVKKRNVDKHCLNKLASISPLLSGVFSDLERSILTKDNLNYYSQILFDKLTDEKHISKSCEIIYYVLKFLSLVNKNPIRFFKETRDPAIFLPPVEKCVVLVLQKINSSTLSHPKGFLNSITVNIHQLLLGMNSLTLKGCCALSRVYAQICKSEGNERMALTLCSDLLKTLHKFSPMMIACIAGVWPDLFEIPYNASDEEVIFHSAIALGSQKCPNIKSKELRSKFQMFPSQFKVSCDVLGEFMSASPLEPTEETVDVLMDAISKRCTKGSYEFFVASSVVIFAAYKGSEWAKQNVVEKHLIPKIKLYSETEPNEGALTLFCKLYAEVCFFYPENCCPEDVLFHLFENENHENEFVSDCAAPALIELLLSRKLCLPESMNKWLQMNSNNEKYAYLKLLCHRAVLKKKSDFFTDDIL